MMVGNYDRRSSDQKEQDTQDDAATLLRLLLEAGAVRFVPLDLIERMEQAGVYYVRTPGTVTNWELRQMVESEPEGIGDVETTAVHMLAAELLRTRRVVEAVIRVKFGREDITSDIELTKALTAFLGGE